MSVRLIAASLALFVLAGLCEVGGDYLVWSWWRNGASWLAGLVGALVLILYGIVPTYQTTHFGRVYAAHGGRLRRPVPRVGLGRRWHPS